jgi:EAL domain-containing protein (putative c-di-GMP-specific phosphodiesterase class I)
MLLNYQPIVDVRTRVVVKAEALCRFPGSPPGLDSPDGFIPYAEQNGLIGGLTAWLFSTAFEYWARLGSAAPELTLNLSVQNLSEPDLAERMLGAADRHKIKPSRLWIELDERLFDVHDQASHATLARLTKAGVRLCLDGLGPGLSPVTHLQLADIPVRELKLDRLVTSGIETDPEQRAKIAGIADIARHLSLELAAKGVEDASLLGPLARAGFTRAQGIAIAPPLDPDAFSAYLQKVWSPSGASLPA